jgi:ferric-dicitrate binding protein FerR (iron transport regulator)
MKVIGTTQPKPQPEGKRSMGVPKPRRRVRTWVRIFAALLLLALMAWGIASSDDSAMDHIDAPLDTGTGHG